MKPLMARYSGSLSDGFWRRVGQLDGDEWQTAYRLGCALQNLEHTVLKLISEPAPPPEPTREESR